MPTATQSPPATAAKKGGGLGLILALVLIGLGVSHQGGGGSDCSATSATTTVVAMAQDSQLAAGRSCSCGRRPRYVGDYTDHAIDEMQRDGITRTEVEDVVSSGPEGTHQSNCRWKVRKGKITVIIDKSATVVTAWLNR